MKPSSGSADRRTVRRLLESPLRAGIYRAVGFTDQVGLVQRTFWAESAFLAYVHAISHGKRWLQEGGIRGHEEPIGNRTWQRVARVDSQLRLDVLHST